LLAVVVLNDVKFTFFGLSVMLVILVNCVFMATSQEIAFSE